VGYVKERRQFGKKLAEFQGLQFMIADMAMEIEAARTLVYQAAAAAERGDANKTFLAAAAKCLASDVAMKVTVDAVQLLGGAGSGPRQSPCGGVDAAFQLVSSSVIGFCVSRA